MKISVIIPVYNRIGSLADCVANVLAFDYDNYELILVNDASTDGTGEMCKRCAKTHSNVKCVSNLTNLGPGLSRNAGLDAADGEYIIFLDSDDRYDKSLLRKVANAANEKHPDIIVYSLWEEYYDKDGKLEYKTSHSLPTCYMSHAEDIHHFMVLLEEETMLGYPWNKAYKLSYLKECGARFTDVVHVEDILFNIEAFENITSLTVLEDRLYHYCNEADNRLTDKYLPDYFELQKLRITKFYEQQKRWGTLDQHALSILSGEYFRWLLSAVERQTHQCIPPKDIRFFLAREFNTMLYANLSKHLRVSKKLTFLYAPMLKRDTKGTIAVAQNISRIKRKLPMVFAMLKQFR